MAFRKVRLKKDILIDTVIASIIVQQSPKFINEYLFKSNPLTGMTLSLSGGAAAYVVGMLMKKNNVSNIGLALAAADVINELVGTSLLGKSPSTADFVQVDSQGNLVPTLNDYSNNPAIMDYSNYQSAY